MAISFVNSAKGSGTVAGAGTFAVTNPASTADGDVGIIVGNATDNINSYTSPGWTQLFNVDETTGPDSGMWVAWKAFSGEGATWTVTSGGGENYGWTVQVFRGVNTTTPVGASACASAASSASQVCGPITVTNTGAWLLAAAESDQPAGGATYTGPGGNFVLDQSLADATNGQSIGCGHEDLLGVTGSTSRTLTCSIADVYVSVALELIPIAAAAPAAGPYPLPTAARVAFTN